MQTLATEYGNYGIYPEQGTPEAVFDHAVDRQGNPLSRLSLPSAIEAHYKGHCDTNFPVAIGWRPLAPLREERQQPGGPRNMLLESWRGFSLGAGRR